MNEMIPRLEQDAKVTNELTPFDDLAKYLEDHERTDSEKLEAISRALTIIIENSEGYPDGLDEIIGIGLEHNIEPDVVIRIFEEQESKVKEL